MERNKEALGDVILVGGKPFMNYVTGVVMRFVTHDAKKVVIKSRGKFISKAVDVAEVVRKRSLKDQNIDITDVRIDTDSYEKEGKEIGVSTMEITLEKK